MATAERILDDDMVAAIQAYIPRYPSKQAVTLPALHIVHEKLRCVPMQAVVEIAALLDLHPAQIQDTLTFYQFFHQAQPHGETRAWVCRSISCALRGADELIEYIGHKLGVPAGQTTPDGKLTVEAAECLGACEHAPCMLAGETLHSGLTREKIDQFLKSL